MVKLRKIIEKLGPDLGFSDHLLNYEIGNYDFDTVKQTSTFVHEYTNTKIQT